MTGSHERRETAVRVLLVEDNPGDAELVLERAADDERRPTRFEVCTTLAEAVAAVARRPPDVIVLDLGLPDSVGLQTFERMQETAAGIPIIVHTGQDDLATAERCIELFAPNLVLGISDEISSTGDLERVRVVGEIVDAYNESR